MKLDFRQQGQIPTRFLPLYNRIAFASRQSFTALIELVSRRNLGNFDWHVCGPSERNVFTSPLFEYCCRFAFLSELLERGEKIEEIVVDSPALRGIIQGLLEERGLDTAVRLEYNPWRRFFSRFSRICGYLFVHLWVFAVGRFTSPGRAVLPDARLTLIDTFVMDGFIDKDRNYPGLLQPLTEEERQLIYFVPTLYRISPLKMLSVWRKMRASLRSFLFKEDYLKISDYFFAWCHWLRIRKISFARADFRGVDFSSLVREEIVGCKGLGSAMIGLLNYRFARRLKESDVKLRLLVDWFENQVIDKGWNYGFRKYYPETPTVGYLGFVTTPYYLCAQPTCADRKAGLLPGQLAVTGRALIQTTREFCPDLEVTTAPAFRFSHLYQPRRFSPTPSCFTVLVGLSFSVSESINIIAMIQQLIASFGKNITFMLKRHPATSLEQLQIDELSLLEKQLEFSDQPFDELLEKSDLLISGVSSICMESLARGIPVIVIGNKNGATYNPIPQSVCLEMWRVCYSVDELKDAVVFFEGRKRQDSKENKQQGLIIRAEYFTPVTKEAVREFLML